MASKFDELRRRASEAARDLDKKFDITEKLNQGARAASDALKKGADAASTTVDAVRDEAARLDREHKITDKLSDAAKRTADIVGDTAKSVVNTADEVATQTGAKQKASEVKD